MAHWYGKYTHCFNPDLTSIKRDRVYRTSMLKWNFKKLFSTFQVMDSYTALLTIEENDVGRKVVHFVQTKMTSIMEGSLTTLRSNQRMVISLFNEIEVYSLLSMLLWYNWAEQLPLGWLYITQDNIYCNYCVNEISHVIEKTHFKIQLRFIILFMDV